MRVRGELLNLNSPLSTSNHHQEGLDQEQQSEEDFDRKSSQSDVYFVLAKQYKSIHHNKKVYGCPAFSASRQLLGFYIKSPIQACHGRFVSIAKYYDDFGPNELLQAEYILQEAINSNTRALYDMKNYESLTSLVDHALNYDGRDVGNPSQVYSVSTHKPLEFERA